MNRSSNRRLWAALGRAAQSVAALGAGAGLTVVFFLLLPLLQEMGRPPDSQMDVRTVDAAVLQPPPPPPPEPEPEEEPADEPPPVELTEQATPPMDLSHLEMALDPGFGDMGGAGALAGGRLPGAGGADTDRDRDADAVFSMADLDQMPKPVNQTPPQYPAELRARKVRGTVHILFVVDLNGRVVTPRVQQSSHSAFERPALEAVRRWRFEPGKRNGQTVQFRMRVPITFACG